MTELPVVGAILLDDSDSSGANSNSEPAPQRGRSDWREQRRVRGTRHSEEPETLPGHEPVEPAQMKG